MAKSEKPVSMGAAECAPNRVDSACLASLRATRANQSAANGQRLAMLSAWLSFTVSFAYADAN
jgi:hypothetical protein